MYGTTKYLANVGNVIGRKQSHRKILATILCCSRNISLRRIFRYALRYVNPPLGRCGWEWLAAKHLVALSKISLAVLVRQLTRLRLIEKKSNVRG